MQSGMVGAAGFGFATGFSLILAIGAQNAFVLRQGLLRHHVFALCLFCALSDAVLIAGGVAGFGQISQAWPGFPRMMGLAGAAFLAVYGAQRFAAAWRGSEAMELTGRSPSLVATLAAAAAFTWLNPHVYLDTLALIGAVSTRYEDGLRVSFAVGAIMASFVFFFGLGYGARLLAPFLQSTRSWQILDAAIGVVMWILAVGLVRSVL